MNKDTRKALERLEAALLQEETEKPELAEDPDDFLDGLLDDPADSLASTGPVIYNNFANGYGKEEDQDPPKKPEGEMPQGERPELPEGEMQKNNSVMDLISDLQTEFEIKAGGNNFRVID